MPKSMKNRKFSRLPPRPQQSISNPSGFIFMCDRLTKAECFRTKTFGLPLSKIDSVHKINPGTHLFLFDCKLKLLYGAYRAASHGGANLVPTAFGGKFPAQVRFRVEMDCTPLPESIFKAAISSNYFKSKFRPELDLTQVDNLLALFQAATRPQPPPLPSFPTMPSNLTMAPPQHTVVPSISATTAQQTFIRENAQYQQPALQPSQVYHSAPPQITQEYNTALPNSSQQYLGARPNSSQQCSGVPSYPNQQYYTTPPQSNQQCYAPTAQAPPVQSLGNHYHAGHPHHLSQATSLPNYQQYSASNVSYPLQPQPVSFPNGAVAANIAFPRGNVVPA